MVPVSTLITIIMERIGLKFLLRAGTNFFYLIVFTLFIAKFISCGKKCDPVQVVTEDRFGIGYPGIMPFTGTDTLIFLKNSMDTVKLYGSGKEVFFVDAFRGGGDCEVHYKLLNHNIDFKKITGQKFLNIHYYKYSETNAFRDFFTTTFDNSLMIGPMDVNKLYSSSSTKLIKLRVLGIEYPNVLPLNQNADTIYLMGPDPKHQIVRVKNGNDIYEAIP